MRERRRGDAFCVFWYISTINFFSVILFLNTYCISSSHFLTTTDSDDVQFWQSKGGKGSKSSNGGEKIFVHLIYIP